MRKLHSLLYKAFYGPFLLTLFVSNFMLLMIWLWKWVDEIVGKGLDTMVILELIGYASLNQIPMSLPLAVLVSSIMAFGKLGETVELTAIKSLGISLWRAMFPLIIVVTITSIGAFFFSNNVLPAANGKMKMLLKDIRMKKPELIIPEGVFYNGLKDHTIRVQKKHKDKTLSDIIIFDDKTSGKHPFVKADSGRMEISADSKYLILTLIDGVIYQQEEEQISPKKGRQFPVIKNRFQENQLIFDLSGNNFNRSTKNLFAGNAELRNIKELGESIDSIGNAIQKRNNTLLVDVNFKSYFPKDSTISYDTVTPFKIDSAQVIQIVPANRRKQVIRSAGVSAREIENYINSAKIVTDSQKKIRVRHRIEWHKKFTLSFACLVMFFIGAPFGAIVRKGGLGTPVLIGILLFMAFHVITMIGDKTAKKMEVEPQYAIWWACMILAPIGLFLTYKATTDSELFNKHSYKNFFSKIYRTFERNKDV